MLLDRIYTILLAFVSILLSTFFLMINLKVHGESNLALPSTNDLLPEESILSRSIIDAEMPKLKQSQLGKVLTRYYNRCLGGAAHWETIKSYKVSGDLNTENGIQGYESIFKKPIFYKVITSTEEVVNILGFDGSKKWQQQIKGEEWTYSKIAPNLQRMIYEPELAFFLLFPFQSGKIFNYYGTERKDNAVCHKVRLLTKQGFLINYYIDVESYFIVSIEVTDKIKEFSSVSIKYSDHRLVDGVYFAHMIKFYVNEQLESILKVNEITTNIGAVNWMFDSGGSSF